MPITTHIYPETVKGPFSSRRFVLACDKCGKTIYLRDRYYIITTQSGDRIVCAKCGEGKKS